MKKYILDIMFIKCNKKIEFNITTYHLIFY